MRKNFPDTQKLAGEQCSHTREVFLSLVIGYEAEDCRFEPSSKKKVVTAQFQGFTVALLPDGNMVLQNGCNNGICEEKIIRMGNVTFCFVYCKTYSS